MGKIKSFNFQSLFSDWKKDPSTHPEMERRDHVTGHTPVYVDDTPGETKYMIDAGDEDDSDDNAVWICS